MVHTATESIRVVGRTVLFVVSADGVVVLNGFASFVLLGRVHGGF